MEPNNVPIDLLPVNVCDLEKGNWASATYHYWSAFSVGVTTIVPTEEDLGKWKRAAADIIEELKALGVRKAHAQIIHMMKHYFNFEHGKKNFTSIYDVADVLSSKELWNKHTALYRDIFYMFQYGIFRVGYNGWALECANEWMSTHNLCYETEGIGRLGRKGKGCVYKIIVSRASNSICDRFQQLTQRLFNEYIVVRDKKIKKYGDDYELKPYTFNHRFPGYLCVKNTHHNQDGKMTAEELNKIGHLYSIAKTKGFSFESFYGSLNQMIHDKNTNGK